MSLEEKIDKPTEVATAVPYHGKKDRFLLAKRTEETDIQPGKWNFPGGRIQKKDAPNSISEGNAYGKIENEEPRDAALRELKEETGLTGKILRSGEHFTVDTVDGKFRIYPFLVLVDNEPELNPEHTDFEWIRSGELEDFETVKGLKEDLRGVGVLDE